MIFSPVTNLMYHPLAFQALERFIAVCLESFRSFRGHLSCKPVTGKEHFFAVSYNKPALKRDLSADTYPTLIFFKRDPTSKIPIVIKTYKGERFGIRTTMGIIEFIEKYKPEPPKIHSHTLREVPDIEIPPGKKVPVLKQLMTHPTIISPFKVEYG